MCQYVESIMRQRALAVTNGNAYTLNAFDNSRDIITIGEMFMINMLQEYCSKYICFYGVINKADYIIRDSLTS